MNKKITPWYRIVVVEAVQTNWRGELRVKKLNTPTINTERLILRKFTDSDLKDMYEIYSDEEVNKFLSWFPFQSIAETK
ncbi:GNAT family N-acetyltransferase [Cytobacillus oceanisediminis]|uniref:GNAT family N-acetyltransferase n=1 Tax=Cytobacillus oceanisediminis TaxID=665099 RepID=UPI0024957C6B|nr:GNAT family N-acetyltransferase [Cytobacillus oceanisediminis]